MPKTMAAPVSSRPLERRANKASHGDGVIRRFVRNPLSCVGLFVLLVFVLAAVLAPVIATHDYTKIDPLHANLAPDSTYLFGTDTYGRDLFSRMVYGTRYSLAIGICAQAISVIFGVVIGAFAGYFGGLADNVILRICDIIQAIPSTLLAIVISQALGSGFVPTVIALGASSVPQTIRLLRSSILGVRGQEYVEAAQCIGCGSLRIMFRHVVPNSLTPIIVACSNGIGRSILTSAGLSYVGLGIQDPYAEWGAMMSLAKDNIRYFPYQIIIPGIAIALVVLAFSLIGNGLRDALDPKLRA